MALLKHIAFCAVDRIAIGDEAPLAAIIGCEAALARPLDQMVLAHSVFDEVADGADLQTVPPREGYEIVEPGHRPVLVHDLADHARGIEPRKAGDVDRRFGMAGAHQHAAIARGKGEDVAGRDDVLRPLAGIDGDRHRARTIGGADSGGDPVLRLDRSGEGGLHTFAIVARHGLEPQSVDPLAVEREADQPAAVSRHEIDRDRRRHLGGNNEIALILPILVIDKDIHAPVARFLDNLLGTDEDRRLVIVGQEGGKLSQGFGGRIPALLGAIAKRVRMKPRRPREAGLAHAAILHEAADLGDNVAHTSVRSHHDVIVNLASHIPMCRGRSSAINPCALLG